MSVCDLFLKPEEFKNAQEWSVALDGQNAKSRSCFKNERHNGRNALFLKKKLKNLELNEGKDLVVTKKWNSIPEFHWNNFIFRNLETPKKWNFRKNA
jgi:hypothetical protein